MTTDHSKATTHYSDNVDYLVSSILYLGSHTYYWARTPSGMSSELSLDEQRLGEVFDSFPAIYRRSSKPSKNGQYFYSLQARYAQRKGGDTSEPDEVSNIQPLETEKIDMLLQFVLKMVEQEKSDARNRTTNFVAVGAAVVSALSALVAASIAIQS